MRLLCGTLVNVHLLNVPGFYIKRQRKDQREQKTQDTLKKCLGDTIKDDNIVVNLVAQNVL